MSKQNEQKPVTEADLRFRHFKLAQKLSMHLIKEAMKEKLTQDDLPSLLCDLCKVIVLSIAAENKEGALYVVSEFTNLSSDLISLMMRIVSDNYGKGIDTLLEETDEPKKP